MAAASIEPSAPPNDRTIPAVAWAVAICTVLFTVVGAVFGGLRFGLSTFGGGAVATANFLVLARVIRALTGSRGQAALWGCVYLLKIVVLFGGVWLLCFHYELASGIGFMFGFTALVPGIVVGGLVAAPKDPTEPADR